MQLHTPYWEAIDTIIIVYLPMSAEVYTVITVHVHICGSSAPRTRPAPDSHMYTTAHALGEGKGGGVVQDQGGPQYVGFRPNFHDVSISRENARLTKFPATELYHGPLTGLPGGYGGGGSLA